MTVPAPAAPVHLTAPLQPEGTVPHPLRFWWLKRLALLCLLLGAVLAGIRAWWGWEADRRLRRALEPLAAAGWSVRGADLNSEAVPDEVNAAAYLKRAVAAIDPVNDSPAASSSGAPFYSAEWEGLSEKSVAGSAKVFPLARRARAFDRFDWSIRMKRPIVATPLSDLNNIRHLANTVGDAALYAHYNGDDAAALETIRDVRHLAKGAARQPFVVSHLVGVGVEMLALLRLQMIAAGLDVGPDGADDDAAAAAVAAGALPATKLNTPRRPASRAQVRGLIAELLDERETRASLKRAFADERASQLDMADWMKQSSTVLRPMLDLDAVRMIEQDEAVLAAAGEPTVPAARARLGPLAGMPAPPPPVPIVPGRAAPKRTVADYTRLLSSNLLTGGISNGRIIEVSMRSRADRRMTAVSLAAQLYRADHGRWPASIDALVPKYLPEVPRDPMAIDGGPLRYLLVKGGIPGGADRPVVYSVGNNGVDDTPDATTLPGAPWAGWHSARDEYRDIAHWAVPAPKTQPAIQPAGANP